jgi:hypothetical protein
MKQPCLDCGRPAEGSRCAAHRQAFSAGRNAQAAARRSRGEGAPRPYDADYRKRAAFVRANTYLCWICGQGFRPHDPWQADHVVAGNPRSELRGAHRSCNIGRANKARSKRGI